VSVVDPVIYILRPSGLKKRSLGAVSPLVDVENVLLNTHKPAGPLEDRVAPPELKDIELVPIEIEPTVNALEDNATAV
jgi:hypothetical protein